MDPFGEIYDKTPANLIGDTYAPGTISKNITTYTSLIPLNSGDYIAYLTENFEMVNYWTPLTIVVRPFKIHEWDTLSQEDLKYLEYPFIQSSLIGQKIY